MNSERALRTGCPFVHILAISVTLLPCEKCITTEFMFRNAAIDSFLRIILILHLLLPLPALLHAEEPVSEPNVIVVGGDRDYPPYEFIGSDGKPAGYNVELTRAIAAVMGINVEIRLGKWGEMRRALANGEVDILQGMAFSEERTREVDFSPPHAVVYQSIWTRRDSRIRSTKDLKGKEVVAMRQSVMHDYLLRNDLGAAYVLTDSLAEALQLLESGKHDAALVAKLPGEYLVKELGLKNIAPIAAPIVAQKYGYAVRKGNAELLGRFSEGLAILKRSGQFQVIHNKWLGVLEPQPISLGRIARYVAMVAVPLLLLLGGTVLWSRTLQKRVTQRTAELNIEIAEKNRALDELRLHQDRLVQADKMASLGILVSGVAHEINNPNGLIMLNIPRFMETFAEASTILDAHYEIHGDFRLGSFRYSRLREDLPLMFTETLNAARRIQRIVDDLKDYSRRDDSGSVEPFDLNEVVQAALRLVGTTVRRSTDNLTVRCAERLPKVNGSSHRIEQVVVNLIVNACQALEGSHGAIGVFTSCDPLESEVCLVVEDDGRGIDPRHLPHLTDPFFTTKREGGGTGLGLWISAGIVNDHGGRLEFSPVHGRGTKVILTLPAVREVL